MMGLVNKRFIRPDGSAIPLREVLRDYDKEADKFRKEQGTYHDAYKEVMKLTWEKGKEEEEGGNGWENGKTKTTRRQVKTFNEALLDMLKADKEMLRRVRNILTKNREIEASEEDAKEMEEGMRDGKHGDFWVVAKALNFDPRRIADATAILYPSVVTDSDAAYHVATKLVTGRVKVARRERSEDPVSDLRELARTIEPDMLLRERALMKLFVDGGQENYWHLFTRDAKSAFENLEKAISSEASESLKLILGEVLARFRKMDSLKVEGAVDYLKDPENGEMIPFPSMHQKAGVQKIDEDKRVLLADEMGVGKTAQALLAFVNLCNREPEKGHKALIICPASLVDHWRKEVSVYLTEGYAREYEPVLIQSHNKMSAIEDAKKAKIVIISYDMIIRTFNGQNFDDVRKLEKDSDAMNFSPAEARNIVDALGGMGFTYVTIDEVHRAKNPNYASKAAIIASSWIRKKENRGRMLVTCQEDDVVNWAGEMASICAKEKNPPKIAAVTDGELEELPESCIVVAPKARMEEISAKYGFEESCDESEVTEYNACQRSAAVHRLVSSPEKGGAEYLVLLTGTPLPTRIADIGNMAAMLEPQNYPNAIIFNEQANKKPKMIRELLLRRMLRRRVDEVMDLPKLEIVTEKIELKGNQRAVYQLVQDNSFDATVGMKMLWTRMASISPKLLSESIDLEKAAMANPPLKDWQMEELRKLKKMAAETPSAKFERIFQMVEEEVKQGKKVVIFSSVLREGVIVPLAEGLRQRGIATEYIDGTVTVGEKGGKREKVRQAFQGKDGPKVLVAMLPTMADGVSLTAASTVIFLDYPYNDSDAKQGIARVWRRRQHKEVKVIFVKALDTIDENAEDLMKEKERISGMLIDGIPLTEEEKRKYEAKGKDKGPFVGALKTPREVLGEHFVRMFGKGGASNRTYILMDDGKNGRSFANNYLFKWDTSNPANNARMIKTLIEAIEKESGKRFVRIADLGSGPGVISRVTGRPTTCVDMNPFMLEAAKNDLGGLVETHEALLDNLPLASGSHDLAVLSFVLHYGQPLPDNGGTGERERMIREALRILAPGGRLIIAEPAKFVNPEGVQKLWEGLMELGCESEGSFMGFASALKGSDFGSFVVSMVKGGEPTGSPVPDSFVMHTEPDIRYLFGVRRRRRAGHREIPEGKKLDLFRFTSIEGAPLMVEDIAKGAKCAEPVEEEKDDVPEEPVSAAPEIVEEAPAEPADVPAAEEAPAESTEAPVEADAAPAEVEAPEPSEPGNGRKGMSEGLWKELTGKYGDSTKIPEDVLAEYGFERVVTVRRGKKKVEHRRIAGWDGGSE